MLKDLFVWVDNYGNNLLHQVSQLQDEQEQDSGGEEEKDDAEERELEAVLMKAQERSDEHEAKKKARLRSARLPPNERDW